MNLMQLKKGFVFAQWFTGLGVTLLLIHVGLMGGWASPTLARLRSPDSQIPLSAEQASWVASLVNLSRFFGGFLGAGAVGYLGSKRAILATVLPIALGWLLVSLADAVEWLYAARLSSGLGLGMAFASFPLYIGEVALPGIRGALISLATLGAPFGQVLASVCGSYLGVSEAAGVYLVLALLLVVLFVWLPESPHHLVRRGQREAARASIHWYRAGQGVQEELEAVEKFVASDGRGGGIFGKLEYLKEPYVRKATFQIIALFSFMQINGLNIVMFFMESILVRAKFDRADPSLIVIYVNICSTCAAAISVSLIDKCGRKFLLLLSSTGTTLAMLGLTCHFLLLDADVSPSNFYLQWLPAFSVFLFMISFFMGLLPVPSAILSEIFPADFKCTASCIAILTGAIMSFLSAKSYQPLLDLLGDAYVFMLYGILSAMIIPYTVFAVMETKGKSLQAIQRDLMEK